MTPTVFRDGPFRFFFFSREETRMQFPWFRDASIEKISVVERLTADHLYWPLLDIDLSVESIRYPAAFPRIAKAKTVP